MWTYPPALQTASSKIEHFVMQVAPWHVAWTSELGDKLTCSGFEGLL